MNVTELIEFFEGMGFAAAAGLDKPLQPDIEVRGLSNLYIRCYPAVSVNSKDSFQKIRAFCQERARKRKKKWVIFWKEKYGKIHALFEEGGCNDVDRKFLVKLNRWSRDDRLKGN